MRISGEIFWSVLRVGWEPEADTVAEKEAVILRPSQA